MEVLRESAKIPETFLLGSNRLMHQFITTEDELNELCD